MIVAGLSVRTPFVYVWDSYRPSAVEWTILFWSFCWVTFLMLLFSKFFPLVPLFEQKESQVFTDDVMIGRARVPAIIREAD